MNPICPHVTGSTGLHGTSSRFNSDLTLYNSCIIISKSIFWFRRRSRLKVFLVLALAAILFYAAEQFEQFWQRVTQRTFLYNYFKIDELVKEEKLFKGFLFLALAAILFNGAERFEQFW